MKLDLHIHLDYRRSFEHNIDYLSRSALDGFGICGFKNIGHIKQIRDRLPGKLIIVGQEVFTQLFHIVALGIEKKINHRLSVRDTISCIHSQGGFAIAAHPMTNIMAPKKMFKSLFSEDFDAIEGFNGLFGPFILPNLLARAISRLKKLPSIAGSDAHRLEHIGSSYIEVPCNSGSATGEVFELIKRGDFTAQRQRIFFDLRHYKEVIMGPRCVKCNARLVFKEEIGAVSCLICEKTGIDNVTCRNGHYVCDSCLFVK